MILYEVCKQVYRHYVEALAARDSRIASRLPERAARIYYPTDEKVRAYAEQNQMAEDFNRGK